MDGNIELRKLPADCLSPVEEVLETNEDWKEFMDLIPMNLEDINKEHYTKKYNGEDIALIENHANEIRVKSAKVLFSEWGTSGRVRPTLNTLFKLLVKAQMFKAADAIANILGIPPPERPLNGPGAAIDTNITNLLNTDCSTGVVQTTTSDRGNITTEQLASHNLILFSENSIVQNQSQQPTVSDLIRFTPTGESVYLPASDILNPRVNVDEPSTSDSDYSGTLHHPIPLENEPSQSSNFKDQIDQDILQNNDLIQFEFKHLEDMTNKFSETPLGSGGFGSVYLGKHEALGLLAVKKIHNTLPLDMVSKMFNTEVRSLSLLRHQNIVPILGFSLDGPDCCIVCEYIDGGSLTDKIAKKVLNKQQRFDIMLGTAEGLNYVHSTVKPSKNTSVSRKAYFTHGDVKSANILLTKDYIPKLCDFGLAKQFDNTYMTKKIFGTTYYMSPESLTGTVTQKSDVYSYGIVLLELLTGYEAVVQNDHAQMNIKVYLEEYCNNGISEFVDEVVGEWVEAQKIYDLAKWCLKTESSDRPTMVEICSELLRI